MSKKLVIVLFFQLTALVCFSQRYKITCLAGSISSSDIHCNEDIFDASIGNGSELMGLTPGNVFLFNNKPTSLFTNSIAIRSNFQCDVLTTICQLPRPLLVLRGAMSVKVTNKRDTIK
jgi:hypothetical protein